ncbi:MAG: hypothetical protein KGJ78_16065 [Alphaproteobacteria bacterium]|nr:hypothetical protein [Alphaproteobacteria bacterium]
MFLLLAVGAVVALCALLWRVAIYAMPVFVGFSIGFWALSLGAGLGAPIIGLVVGVACWELAKRVFAHGNKATKAGIAILLALPAGYMGFEIVWQICSSSSLSEFWRAPIAGVAGMAAFGTCLKRLTLSSVETSAAAESQNF